MLAYFFKFQNCLIKLFSFVNMETTCCQTFLSMSSDETEGYPHPKRIKIENSRERIEKWEQHQLEQRTLCVGEHTYSSNEPIYVSEGSYNLSQHAWRLEKESSDTEKKSRTSQFTYFKPWINDKLKCRLLENKLFTKSWNPENADQNILKDDTFLNECGQLSSASLYNIWNVNKKWKSLYEIKSFQGELSTNIDKNNNKNSDNELKGNASVSSLNTTLFQVSSQKIDTDEKLKEHQFLDVPFLCSINSVYQETENKDRNNCLKKLPTEENNEQLDKRKRKSFILPILNCFQSRQTLEILHSKFFVNENIHKFPSVSNTLNKKILSSNLKMQEKNIKNQTYVMQHEKVCCSQNISEKEKLQNDNSAVNASSVRSKCNECNHQSINNQVPGSLAADVKKMHVANFRYNCDNIECDLMFAENNFEGKQLKNSDSGEEQEPDNLRIHTYIGSGKSQNNRCYKSINILKCTLGKVSCENVEIFNIKNTTIPLITEILRKDILNINYDMDYSNYNMHVESILSSTKIIDIKPHSTTHVATEGNCPYNPGQDFLYSRDTCNVLTGKKLSEQKICFHDMLFRGFKAWPSYKDVHKYQEVDIIISWNLLYEILKSKVQYIILEVIPSICNNSNNSDTQINLQAKLEYKNMTTITNCASFFGIISGLHPIEEKCTQVEKYALYCRKQIQFNMSLNNSWTKNTQSQPIYKTYPSIRKENINCKLMKNIIYELHHNTHFSRTIAKKEDSYVLTTETLFHKQQRKSPKGKCVTQYCLLTNEGIEIHNPVSMFNSEGKDMSLILPDDNFDSFCLWKTFWCNTKKIQDLTKIKFRLNYLPSVSQMKIEKLSRKCSNLHKPVVTLKQKKKQKQIQIYKSSHFIREKLKTLHFVLSANKKFKTRVLRISFTNEARYFFPKFLRTATKVSIDKKDYCNCRELPRNSCNLATQKCISLIFDTYEKIPLSTDSEELDQIQFTKHVNSNNEICIEDRKVSSLTNMYRVPDKSNDALLLPGLPPTMVATCSSLLQQGSERNKTEYPKDIDPHIYYLENEYKYVNFPASGINFGNIGFSGDRQCDTSAFHSGSLLGEDKMKKSGESKCRISLSHHTKIQYEEINSIVQYPAVTNSAVSDNSLYSKTQGEEMTTFSLYEDIQTDSNFGTFNSEPMTMTQNLEYLNEEGEISAKQNYITQKNQKQTEMNGNTAIGLILSHSEDESEICHASGEKLKTHFSIKNNGCLEDVEDSKRKNITEFELKSKFDLVLEELCVFHEISKENENNISKVETNIQEHSFELNNSVEMEENFQSISQKKVCISSPICGIIAEENINKQNQSSLKEKPTRNGGQEEHESCSSDMPDEELLYTPDKGKHMELL